MQGKHRLKKRNEFRRVFRKGQSFANRQLVIYTYMRKDADAFRLGISVSRKVGNAVTRNRIKRCIKEITRLWAPWIHPQLDIVIIARKPVAGMNYDQIRASLRHLYNKSQIFVNGPPKSK